MKKYDLAIIDGNNIAHKAFHIHAGLSARIIIEGTEVEIRTGISYGMLKHISLLKNKFLKDDGKIILVWDKFPSRKLEIYPEYKEARMTKKKSDAPSDFKDQVKLCQLLVSKSDVNQAYAYSEEADDVVATLAHRHKKKTVLISSGDKDLSHLITDDCHKYYRNSKGIDILMTRERYVKLMGFEPIDFLIIQIMMGDAIDSIPGVVGIGDKTSLSLFEQFTDAEKDFWHRGIMKVPEALEEWLIKRIERKNKKNNEICLYNRLDYAKMFERNYKLMKLAVNLDNIEFIIGRKDGKRLKQLLDKYEFTTDFGV